MTLIILSGCGRVGFELLPLDGSISVGPEDSATPDPDADLDIPDVDVPDADVPDADVYDDASCTISCENEHGSASCSAGECQLICSNGYGDCDGLPGNGCETSTAEAVVSCGECGMTCTNPNGSTSCSEGVCEPVCNPGSADCDNDRRNGCETVLNSVEHCGECGSVCTNLHGTTACMAGSCAPTCAAGYSDCDGDPTNGCEARITDDPLNCGGCGTACDTSFQACIGGNCEVSMCPQGRGDCDTNRGDCETNLTSTVAHCGFCGNACTVANGAPRCSGGSCQIASCNSGFANCDNSQTNGCEVPLNTSVNHCGRCGNACTNAHGSTTCSGGTCVPSCSSGWGSCDGNPQNGCETSLNTVSNCGTCGRVCPNDVPNASPACNAGVCTSVCNNLSGVYALKITVPATWSAGTWVRAGSGTFVNWGRVVLTQSGTNVTGTVVSCGRTVPDFQNSAINERYGVNFPASLFDRALPTSPISGTLSAVTPSATFSFQRSAMYMGLTMSDPINGTWPSPSQINSVDHDGDGLPGITVEYKSGNGFSDIPTSGSLFPARANRGYLAERVVFTLNGTLTSCTTSSGSATVPDIESRTIGCRLTSGSQCNSSQYGHLESNTPAYETRAASYTLTKIAEPSTTVTCAQVRSALP